MHHAAGRGVDETDARVIRQQAIRPGVGTVGQRQDDEPRRVARNPRRACRLLDPRGDLDGGQQRIGGDVDAAMKRAQQGDRHAAVELAHDAGPMHGRPVDVLREVLVRAPGQEAVGAAGRDDEVAGPHHSVDNCSHRRNSSTLVAWPTDTGAAPGVPCVAVFRPVTPKAAAMTAAAMRQRGGTRTGFLRSGI